MTNIIETIALTVLAVLLLSGLLKRPYLFARNTVLAFLSSAVLVGKMPEFGIGAIKALTTSSSFPIVVVVGTAIAAATVFFGVFGVRFHGMLSMLFSGLPLYCILSVVGVRSALGISIGAAVAMMLVGFIFSEGYFAVERSALGAMFATTAAAMVLNLGQTACMIILTAVGVAGSVTGIAVEASRSAKARKARRDEQPAA